MLDFTKNNSSYEDQKMRRKVEVLKYKKNVNETKKTHFSVKNTFFNTEKHGES